MVRSYASLRPYRVGSCQLRLPAFLPQLPTLWFIRGLAEFSPFPMEVTSAILATFLPLNRM